jgi:phage terminase small subunit
MATQAKTKQEQAKTNPNVSQSAFKNAGATKRKDGFTLAQRKFIEEFLKDGNGRQAAIRAGYAENSASQSATKLLKLAHVKAAIEQGEADLIQKIQADTGITLERTLKELARLAFFDPRKLFSKDGKPLAINELDDDTAASIAGLDVLEEFDGSGKDRVFIGMTKKYKLTDKRAALDMLMKHLGGYKEDNKQSGEAAAGTVSALLAEMKGRKGLPVVKDLSEDDDA